MAIKQGRVYLMFDGRGDSEASMRATFFARYGSQPQEVRPARPDGYWEVGPVPEENLRPTNKEEAKHG